MLTRSFRGYGAVTDSEYESVQSLVGQLNNAINTAKQVLTGLVAGCASIDPQLSTRILDVESFIETRVKPAIDDWQNGVVLFDTIRGYIDDEVAVLDDLVAKMNAYGCATGVLANGQIGQRPELASGGGGGGGGASSGGGGGRGRYHRHSARHSLHASWAGAGRAGFARMARGPRGRGLHHL